VEDLASFLQRQEKAAMPEWWARRKAALGLSTSGPIPDPPFVTSSIAMSLSGYYFRPAQRVRMVTSASPRTQKPASSKKKQESEEKSAINGRPLDQYKAMSKDSLGNDGSSTNFEVENKIVPERTRKVKKV